jgi:hypothetical protein
MNKSFSFIKLTSSFRGLPKFIFSRIPGYFIQKNSITAINLNFLNFGNTVYYSNVEAKKSVSDGSWSCHQNLTITNPTLIHFSPPDNLEHMRFTSSLLNNKTVIYFSVFSYEGGGNITKLFIYTLSGLPLGNVSFYPGRNFFNKIESGRYTDIKKRVLLK